MVYSRMDVSILILVVKYLLEGFAVAVASFIVSGQTKKRTLEVHEVVGIGLAAAGAFLVLDILAPLVGGSARQGAGFGLGARQVGWPGAESFVVGNGCPVGEGGAVKTLEGAILLMKDGVLRPFTSIAHYETWGAPTYFEMDDATLARCEIGDPLEATPELSNLTATPPMSEADLRLAVDPGAPPL